MTSTQRDAQAYLDRLDALLGTHAPAMREEVLGGIREHLAEAAASGDPDAVQAALVRLGPPETVLAAALGDGEDAPPIPRARAGSLVPIWAGVLMVGATVAGFLVLGALLSITARFDEDSDWSIHPFLVLAGAGACTILGCIATVLVWTTRDWRVPERIGLTAAWVVSLLAMIVASVVSAASDPGIGFVWAAGLALLGGLIALLLARWALGAIARR